MKEFKGRGQERLISANSIPSNHKLFMLGHELGNVLNGLLGMTGLLRESGLSPEQRRWLDAIEQSGKQMHQLIASSSSVDCGAGPGVLPQIVRMDGIKLLEQVVISQIPAARASKNRLALLVDPDLPRYWCGDPCRLRQLLDNLLGNSAKFTQNGKIVLTATTSRRKNAPAALVLRVSDSGPGIPAAVAQRIFEPYRQGNDVSGTKPVGMGLGLFICQRIARLLNARLDWSEPEGGGACFEVTLQGALDASKEDAWPGISLMSRIHCLLELRGTLRLSTENFLSRLGVSWSDNASSSLKDTGDRLRIRISQAGRSEKEPSPALKFEPLADGCGVKILLAPLLQSALAPLLLNMALQWLSPGDKQGSDPGLCRPEPTDAPDLRPG